MVTGGISAKPLSFILLLRFRGLGIESDFYFTYDYLSGTIPVEMVPDVVKKLEEKRLVFVSGYSSYRKDGIYRAYTHYFFRRWPFDVRQMLEKLLQEYVNKSLAAICGKTLKSSEQLKEAIVTLFWEKYNHLDEEARRSIKKFLGWIENAIPIVRPYSSVVDIEFWEWEELSRLVEVLRHRGDFETTRPILEQIGLLEKIKFVDRSSNRQEDTYVVFPYIGELKNRIFSVFVGTKPVMNYVLAVITQFNEGASEVCIKARGRAISRAVDTAEIVRQRFLPNVVVRNISIGTETLQAEDGRKVNVSTIEIILSKKK